MGRHYSSRWTLNAMQTEMTNYRVTSQANSEENIVTSCARLCLQGIIQS
jgi:hypothetical protein